MKQKLPPYYQKTGTVAPLKDLLPGIAPEHHITILSGDPYVGKTRLALCIARALATGEGYFWDKTDPLRIGYFSERSSSSVARNMQDYGWDVPENLMFIPILDLPLKDANEYVERSMEWLQGIIKAYSLDVVFLDTFGHFLPAYARTKGAMNDYSLMAKATVALQQMSLRLKVTPFCIHHNAKEKAGNEYKSHKAKSSGSASIAGNTLALWSLSEVDGRRKSVNKEDGWRQLEVAYHHGADQTLYFKTAESGMLIPADPPGDRTGEIKKDTKLFDACEMLEEGKEVLRTDFVNLLMDHLDVSYSRAQNIVSILLERKMVIQRTDDNGKKWLRKILN